MIFFNATHHIKRPTLMKTKVLLLLTALGVGLVSCDQHDHDHDDHDHEPGDHAHGDGGDHDHDHDGDGGHDHTHEKGEAGPNGGRLITSVKPHLEFLVTEDRKVQLTFLEDDHKTVIAPAEQVVSVVAGDRSNPTALAFARSGDALLSDKALPEGDDFPTVLTIQLKPDAEKNREKFNLDFSDCPTCDYLEYACICGHGEHDH